MEKSDETRGQPLTSAPSEDIEGQGTSARSGPLRDVVVIDLTRMLAGPYGTTVLGDLGADVIKIETPSGDPIREIAPFVQGQSHYHLSVNRNKRSAVLDLRSDEGRDALRRLIAQADVVVENFRPGVMSSMGFDPDELLSERPELIICSVSGFGADGPLRDRRSFDLIAQAMSGVMSVTGEPGHPPVRAGVPIGDLIAGLYAAIAIVAALHERELSGRGQHIDVSMLDGLVSLLANIGGRYFATGEIPEPVGAKHPTTVPYGAFRAKDGYIAVATLTPAFWPRLCEAIGLQEFAKMPEFATYEGRREHRSEVEAAVEEALSQRTVAEWSDILEAAGVPYGPILNIAEVAHHEHIVARGMVQELDHPVYGRFTAFASPLRMLGVDRDRAMAPPMLGEHTDEILDSIRIVTNDVRRPGRRTDKAARERGPSPDGRQDASATPGVE